MNVSRTANTARNAKGETRRMRHYDMIRHENGLITPMTDLERQADYFCNKYDRIAYYQAMPGNNRRRTKRVCAAKRTMPERHGDYETVYRKERRLPCLQQM